MPQLIANIGSRQALVDDVLVGSKVRYLSNFSAAPHFGERPESAHLAHSRAPDLRLLIEPTPAGQPCRGNGSSCPLLSFAAANPVGSLAEFLVLFDAIFSLNQDLLLEKH